MRYVPSWTQEYHISLAVDMLRTLALRHAEAAGPFGSEAAELIRKDKLRDLIELDVNFAEVPSAEAARQLCQAIGFFKKLEPLELGYDREAVAWDKFTQAEALCRETNELIRLWHGGKASLPPRICAAFYEAQCIIGRVLGEVPSREQLGYRFGKGATTLTPKRLASLREKVRVGVSCSEELLPEASAILAELPKLTEAWANVYAEEQYDIDIDACLESYPEGIRADVEAEWRESRARAICTEFCASVPVTVSDGTLAFVPKNAKTHRSVVVEPVLNGIVQMAYGDLMVKRLARVGIDLSDQTRNQEFARIGSLTGALATLDLSSASDTISKELVASLLPLDWYVALARARTGHVTYRDQRLTLEKFSSMGNGYTFPLETLIFWSLCRAVCDDGDTVSVYGDDIIVPSARYESVCEVLRYAGFIPNKDKSYHTGPFRESCGSDWYSGTSIRPFFQKDGVSPRTLFVLHNFYIRNGYEDNARLVQSWIKPALRIFGPDGYGDGHLLGVHNRKRKDAHVRKGWGGYLFDTYVVTGRTDDRPGLPGDFVLPPYNVYRRSAEPLFRSFGCGPDRDQDQFTARVKFARYVGEIGYLAPGGVSRDGTPTASLPINWEEVAYVRQQVYTLG